MILSIVFYMVIAFCLINIDSAFYLIFVKYIQKINKIKTNLFKPIKLLIALKNICDTKLSRILEILIIIIK